MKTGIVIVHYNDYESLIKLIDNIKDYKVIDKIVIVDNNSNEDNLDKVRKISNKKIKLIENKDNRGFAYAINIGSKYLIKEYGECNIIISNADIIIDKESDIKELISDLDKKDVGVISPTVLENGNMNRGWKNPSPLIDALMNIVVIHRLIRKNHIFYKDSHYKGNLTEVDVVSGCFFLIKSKTLEKINYMDEKTFLYYEENILAKKLKDFDLKTLINNDIIIYHNHSISIDKNIKRIKKYKIQKQSQYYFQKTYNNANLLERGLLKVTAFLSKIILTVVYFIKDLLK